MTGPPPGPTTSWQRTFAALRHRNYRLWFRGQLVSLLGTWMQMTAQGFLVYELTRSPSYLGLVGFAAGAPTWIFTLYGGVVADRFPRRSLMLATQTAMMLLAFVLAGLTFLDLVQPWHIVCLALSLGTANAFDAPARQAFVGEMVPPEDLTNAIALNATIFNAATAVGPAVAGVTYALFGPAWCFTINALSFVAVIVALLLMRLEVQAPARRAGSSWAQLTEGIRYILGQPILRTAIGMVATTSFLALSMVTLLPAWSVKVLHGGPTLNGLLLSARGVGALLGALLIAWLGSTVRRGKLLTAGSLFYPVLFLTFAFVRWIPASIFAFAAAGAGVILVLNLANAIVQTSTPAHLRGRVMGTYTWIFFGFIPLGSLWIGLIAERFGEPTAIVVSAVLASGFSAGVFLLAPALRRQP